MASDEDDTTFSHQGEFPPFRKEITDLKFINISIKCYEKKTGSGFKEEYYAFKILSMWVLELGIINNNYYASAIYGGTISQACPAWRTVWPHASNANTVHVHVL